MASVVHSNSKLALFCEDMAEIFRRAVPFSSQLGIGSGLAMRANLREGDRLLTQVERGQYDSPESLMRTLQLARHYYSTAFDIAATRCGVKGDLQKATSRGSVTSEVMQVPDDKLCRTRFGLPVCGTSRRNMLDLLAHRIDVAAHLDIRVWKMQPEEINKATFSQYVSDLRETLGYFRDSSRQAQLQRHDNATHAITGKPKERLTRLE